MKLPRKKTVALLCLSLFPLPAWAQGVLPNSNTEWVSVEEQLTDSGELEFLQYQENLHGNVPPHPVYPPTYQSQIQKDEAEGYDTLMPNGLNWSKHGITTTVLPGTDGGMGLTSVDLRTQFSLESFPLLSVTPRFRFNFVDGPTFTDVPSRLYDTALDFSLFLPINQQWSFYGGVAPGIYSDFDNMSSDAFRITGRALFNYKRSENLRFSFGFIYLDRDDIAALPAAGLVWTPESMPALKFDIMFPKPKISYTYSEDQSHKKSLYLAGEFGGGTWAIERASGLDDNFTYSDLRLLLGIEQILTDQYTWFAEAGYVFNRSIEYSTGPEMDLDESGLIRAGLRY
ncbi:MAG: hypothetical protein HON04_06545 [Planctomicrobium sp.]|nr:hypothetical protein [Planctomicrobium sp.]